MKPIFAIFTRAALFTGLLGAISLALSPELGACSPVPMMKCPVAGLGPDMQPDGCPGGYCSRMVSKDNPSLDYKGGKIYFCCPKCIERFKKETAKFAANANHQLASSFQAMQTACPLCGGKVNTAVHVTIGDKRVYFCSEECKKKVAQAKPAEQLQMVFADAAFARGFTTKTATSPKTSTPAPNAQSTLPAKSGSVATSSCGCCCQTKATQQVRVKRD